MPEGHTIHRAAREHGRLLVGRAVRASSPQGRFARGAALVDGRTLRDVEPYGKNLFYAWDDDHVIHVHLGLAGKFLPLGAAPAAPRAQVRLRLLSTLGGADLIAPVICRMVTRADRDAVVARLGPDPLRPDANFARFARRVRASDRSIGALLMDQGVVAGVGNVLRAEGLFATRLDPLQPGSSLTSRRVRALWDALSALMRDAVARGRILSLPIAEGTHEREGRWVYRQDDCRRCGTTVERTTLDGRTVHWCPRCQPRAALRRQSPAAARSRPARTARSTSRS